MSRENATSYSRIYWIDICKFYGMFLVFYGHLWTVETIPTPSIYLQFKFIYSFHMPLFFIISGIVSKSNRSNFHSFMEKKFFTRIVPYIFFNFSLLCVYILTNLAFHHQFPFKKYLYSSITTLTSGRDQINTITWFLACLFTVEIVDFFISPKVNKLTQKILLALSFYIVGIIITRNLPTVSNLTGISPNFWFIHESFLGYSFFLFGLILQQSKILDLLNKSFWLKSFCLLVSSILVFLTFNLNNDFHVGKFFIVLMINSSHGNPIWFLITALAGSLTFICLSQLTVLNKVFIFFGQNTLILLGLNGFFNQILNHYIVTHMPFSMLNGITSFLICSSITIVSLIMCIPLILLINKFLPSLVGKPVKRSPITSN